VNERPLGDNVKGGEKTERAGPYRINHNNPSVATLFFSVCSFMTSSSRVPDDDGFAS
jgi:hypothetical protein